MPRCHTEGHPSDLSGLALISPMPEGAGYQLRTLMPSLATRIPMLLMAGERDNASKDAIQSVRPLVERGRLNKIELYPSNLHGFKLLRLEPRITESLVHFLDNTLKNRAVAWEPQYNLLPVTVTDIQAVRHGQPRPADAAAKPAAEPKAPAAGAGADPGADAKADDAPPAVRPKARPGRAQPPDNQD